MFIIKRAAAGFAAALALIIVAGCAASAPPTARHTVAPQSATAVTSVAPRLSGTRVLSRTYQLSPSGPLKSPQTVRLPLTRRVPVGWSVVVATAETRKGPWSYLPAALSSDRRTAVFTTSHHSLFTVIGENVGALLGFFKTEFLDGLSSGTTAEAAKPSCAGQTAARSGYTVRSGSGPAVYWCFGLDSSGQRVLRIVNNRMYPLELEHPGLTVTERPAIDYGSLSSLSHLVSGQMSILAPGGQIGYRVSLSPGQEAGAETAIDGVGQGLLALQTGINSLLAILFRFGAEDSPEDVSKSVTVLNRALGDTACADALSGGNPGSILSSCLSPADLAKDFGTVGVLLAPLAAAGGLADFFGSEFQALHDTWTHDDQYTVLLNRTAAVPVLGQPVGDFSHGTGWGQVRPSTVFNGGDPTGLLQHVTWSSWGGSTATGTGLNDYSAPGQTVADGTEEPATIVAFDLGTCDGKLMYQKITWYFPQHGQSFHPSQYENICTGTYSSM